MGGNVRKGKHHGTKVYFVKQLQVADQDQGRRNTYRSHDAGISMFNVDQCEGLPDSVLTLGAVKVPQCQ